MVRQETIEKYEDILNNIFSASYKKEITSDKFNNITKGVDSHFKKLLVDKGILLKENNPELRGNLYKWDSIRPSKDMAVAIAKECYTFNKDRKKNPIRGRRNTPNTTTNKVSQKNTPKNRNPKTVVSYFWGLYKKTTY